MAAVAVSRDTCPSSSALPILGAAVAVCLGYFIGANIGFILRLPPATPSILWPPNSILTATLLLAAPRRWWIYLLAALPAHLVAELPVLSPTSLVYFLFATNCLEALIGATAVLACFCVITWRGLRAATHAPDRFGTFLAIGITVMIAFQAFFNISVVLGLLPTKGIPLPFVSAGGSSLLVSLLGMAILLNIAQHASTPEVVTMTMAKSDA